MGKQMLIDEDLVNQSNQLLNQQAEFVEKSKEEMLGLMQKLSDWQDQLIKCQEDLILYKEAFFILYEGLEGISKNEIGAKTKAAEAIERYKDLKLLSQNNFDYQNN